MNRIRLVNSVLLMASVTIVSQLVNGPYRYIQLFKQAPLTVSQSQTVSHNTKLTSSNGAIITTQCNGDNTTPTQLPTTPAKQSKEEATSTNAATGTNKANSNITNDDVISSVVTLNVGSDGDGYDEYDEEHLVLREGHFLDKCRVQANKLHLQPFAKQRTDELLPLLTGVAWAPSRRSYFEQQERKEGNNTVTSNTKGNSKEPYRWTITFGLYHHQWWARHKLKYPDWKKMEWVRAVYFCDEKKAYVVGGGCPRTTSVTIQCPQSREQPIENVTINNTHTYYVGAHMDCERNHPLHQPAPGTNLMGAVLTFGQKAASSELVVDWIEYHRMIGFQHFFVYLIHNYPDNVDPHLFPNLPYVTYIPFNVFKEGEIKSDNHFYWYQQGIQVDALQRARAAGVEWLAYNDVDEYVQLLGPNNSTNILLDLSPMVDKDPNMGALSLATWTFGNGHNVTKRRRHEMSYVWRATESFQRMRRKCIVRTGYVDYYGIHVVTLGTKMVMADSQAFRINHYKSPQDGPFMQGLGSDAMIVKDTSLRDMYLTRLEDRVALIEGLRAEMAEMANMSMANMSMTS